MRSQSRWFGVRVAVVPLVAGLLLALCSSAEAGGYSVYTCADSEMRALGPTIGVPNLPSGWSLDWTGSPIVRLSDECPLGDRFTVELFGGANLAAGQGDWARWTAAPGTELVGLDSSWGAMSDLNPNRGHGTAELKLATDQEPLFVRYTPLSVYYGVSGLPRFAGKIRPAKWFEIRFTCLDQCATYSGASLYFYVRPTRFDVEDGTPPNGGLLGPATDAQTWSGVMHFALNAGDVGGGLFRAAVEVDGADALAVPLGGEGGFCHDIGPSPDVNEFAAAQPCPLRIDDGSLDIDSSKLPQGQHTVRVLLEDAAGNRTAIFGPVVRRISASGAVGPGSDPALRGAANGDGASDQATLTAHWGKRGGRTRLVSAFGHAHVVRGRLRAADGAPIANASIDVVSRTTAVGARELGKRNGPRTRNDGSWFLVLPRGASSRDVSVRYRSHVNDTVPSATASVRLRVRAGLRLAIHPRVARRGQRIRFDGRLLGGPLPRGGKQIVLMARASRGPWVRFNVVRSGRAGRFRAIYRFQQPGAARYRFRGLSLAEAAYPYLAGGSNVVVVRKR
jgi:hypothetical protein